MTMIHPSVLLAFLAAILRAAATAAFRKLSLIIFPFSTLVMRTLSNATSGVILATKISHHYTRPVAHGVRVLARGEFLDNREDIHIIGQQELLVVIRVSIADVSGNGRVVEEIKVLAEL